MAVSPLDSFLYGGLLGDAAIASILSDEAELAAMIQAEAGLARVEAHLGLIPREAGLALAAALAEISLKPADLAAGTAKDGLVTPILVATLKANLPAELGNWLHWGATSQDISDLALVLRLRGILDIFAQRLDAIIATLAALAASHRQTICLARTRTQQAAPTLFCLKAAQWLAPFLRHRARLVEIRPRLLAVQLGGATGTLSAIGVEGPAVMDALAAELGLGRAEPWHNARDRLVEFASFCGLVAGSIGKIGLDFSLLAQSEIAEIGFTGSGGSSTLPQKQNPIIAEVLVALARYAQVQAGGMQETAFHANERDGAAWTLEWLILPPLIAATGAALLKLEAALSTLKVDRARMLANIEASGGLVLAEAASFALARFMPKSGATALVKGAVTASLASGRHLIDELQARTQAPVDWLTLRAPQDYLAPALALTERILAQVQSNDPTPYRIEAE